MGLALRTHQAQFMEKGTSFKWLNFIALKYSVDCQSGECVCVRVCVGGVGGAQLGSHVWPQGLHHEGSMPGFSVWSLITYTTEPLVVACVPSTACCKACFKCSLCVQCWCNRGALYELCVAQQQRKTRHGEKVMWELKDSIQSSLKSHLRRRWWWWWGGGPNDEYPLMVEACVQSRNSGGTQMEVFCELGQPF